MSTDTRLLGLAGHISQGVAGTDNADDDMPYLPIRIKVGHTCIGSLWLDDAPVPDFNSMQSANARFIAEAFNVTHETGLTPRELARDREELAASVLAWWKDHEFDECCDRNIYSEDPEFVTIAQRLTKP